MSRWWLSLCVVTACSSRDALAPAPAPAPPAVPTPRATVLDEQASSTGEARMFSAVVADLDGDGDVELVTAGFVEGADGRRSIVSIYDEHDGAWTLRAKTDWGARGSTIRNVEVADVDGDGREDIVGYGRVGGDAGARARLVVFTLREGTPKILAETEWQQGAYTHGYGLDVGDLDGDGKLEIVTGGFQSDGKTETGFVRVWSAAGGTLGLVAEATLDGQGAPSMRVNGVALGDLDGDGRLEIVVAGRDGLLKSTTRGRRDQRRESGDISVLSFVGGALQVRARHNWKKGSTTRLRSVDVADLDGDHAAEIVTGGQFDGAGKPCLGVFALTGKRLVLRHDATIVAAGVTGEIRHVVIDGEGPSARVITTGPTGTSPSRQGELSTWRMHAGKLERDVDMVSSNGDETRARAAVVVPSKHGPMVITVGHALKQRSVIGQMLAWTLPDS